MPIQLVCLLYPKWVDEGRVYTNAALHCLMPHVPVHQNDIQSDATSIIPTMAGGAQGLLRALPFIPYCQANELLSKDPAQGSYLTV